MGAVNTGSNPEREPTNGLLGPSARDPRACWPVTGMRGARRDSYPWFESRPCLPELFVSYAARLDRFSDTTRHAAPKTRGRISNGSRVSGPVSRGWLVGLFESVAVQAFK